MKRYLIAANWKMNKLKGEAASFFVKFNQKAEGFLDVDVVVCPPFTLLDEAIGSGPSAAIGAQHMHSEDDGAYTGEISPLMLKATGASFVILGHSERRLHFNETDDQVRAKTVAAHSHGITPIVCVGETVDARKADNHIAHVESQLEHSLPSRKQAEESSINEMIVAYEPIWAIGTGEAATPEQAEEMHSRIYDFLEKRFGEGTGFRILYGGSVKPGNASDFLKQEHVDGLLVGGASLDPDSFAEICQMAEGLGGH